MTSYENYTLLKDNLIKCGKIAVAFSGGVDSTFLLKTAHDILGDNAIAITAKSSLFPHREYEDTIHFCKRENIKQYFIEPNQLEFEEFVSNSKDRCYICKMVFFSEMKELAKKAGDYILTEGSNIDDLRDYRPGLRAIEVLNIISPLRDAGLTKSQIRDLSKEIGLSSWDKPSYACLATRNPYGDKVTEDKLKRVEFAEEYFHGLGFVQSRVRIHGLLARIELPEAELTKIFTKNIREEIISKFKNIGFSYVSLDIEGYRTGSMNEVL